MRNLLLSAMLVAVPVGAFAVGYRTLPSVGPTAEPTPVAIAVAGPSLGDMSPFEAIGTDVQGLAASGDLAASAARITDLETAWDDAQATLRPVNTAYWGNVDNAIDAALSALRAPTPDPAAVETSLAAMQAELADPSLAPDGTATAAPGTVAGIATTDANGRALPCEVMLESFRTKLDEVKPIGDALAAATAFRDKGTERCNADDDARADAFFAQGIALLSQ